MGERLGRAPDFARPRTLALHDALTECGPTPPRAPPRAPTGYEGAATTLPASACSGRLLRVRGMSVVEGLRQAGGPSARTGRLVVVAGAGLRTAA